MGKVNKAKAMLSLALIRELRNRVTYYRSMIDRNIARYREFIEKVRHIAPEKAKAAEHEIKNLEYLKLAIDRIELLLEAVLTRLETMIVAEDILGAAALMKNLVRELKKSPIYALPFAATIVDRVDTITSEIISGTKLSGLDRKFVDLKTKEAIKIIEEARKIAMERATSYR